MKLSKKILLSSLFFCFCACNPQKIGLPIVPMNPQDPLFQYQWHLQNTGQLGGNAGEDINVSNTWQSGNKGQNILVAVVDDGMDINHEDLSTNVLTSQCYDYTYGTTNIQGVGPNSKHGTAVSGIIAAKELNSIGGKGVAPLANLIGFNLIANSNSTTANAADAMTRNSSNVYVSNNSWGPTDSLGVFSDSPTLWKTAIDTGITTGRSNKGISYFFAAGNGAQDIGFSIFDNSNYDGYANYYGVTAVAAIGDDGIKADYSEKGANIWISAPSEGGSGTAITTSDYSGDRGYNDGSVNTNYFQQNYTNTFNGTSAATPMVSGIAALMYKANPNLTWRDVRIIMAQTARKNDPTNADWSTNGAAVPVGGYNINHSYGFGTIDADAAVSLAKTWTNVGALKTETYNSAFAAIPINDGDGTVYQGTVTIAGSAITKIEYVEITLNITHTHWGNLEISLARTTGPATSDTLSETHNCLAAGLLCSVSTNSWRFGSSRHLGESVDGDWTFSVEDIVADGQTGSWSGVTLTFYGE